jgi:hypothetical protein
VLQQKRELFKRILGDGDTSTESLSMNAAEIFGLFDLKAIAGKETKSIGPEKPEENLNDSKFAA